MADLVLFLRNAIVIDHGTVMECSDPAKIGRDVFLISWVDEAGDELCLFDTPDYVIASHEAKEARRDFDARLVVERFRHTGGRAIG